MEVQDRQLFDDDEPFVRDETPLGGQLPGMDEQPQGETQPHVDEQPRTTEPSTTSEPRAITFTAVETAFHPDLQNIKSATLKDGPRSLKIAKFSTIRDRHTGEAHHEALSIQTFHRKQGQLNYDRKHTISLSSEGEDEIQMLLDFLLAVRGVTAPEPSGQSEPKNAPNSRAETGTAAQAGELVDLLLQLPANAALQNAVSERAVTHPTLFGKAAAALNLATYRAALQELTRLIEAPQPASEPEIQHLLRENLWMLGSQYSEVFSQEGAPTGQHPGFARQTAEGTLEWIEIKAPFQEEALFQHDASSQSYYPGAELAKAIGGVQRRLESLDARRDTLPETEDENSYEVRAKIIIGRDGETNQQTALRRLNRHLSRIEVRTYDQLLRIAVRVVAHWENQIRVSTEAEPS